MTGAVIHCSVIHFNTPCTGATAQKRNTCLKLFLNATLLSSDVWLDCCRCSQKSSRQCSSICGWVCAIVCCFAIDSPTCSWARKRVNIAGLTEKGLEMEKFCLLLLITFFLWWNETVVGRHVSAINSNTVFGSRNGVKKTKQKKTLHHSLLSHLQWDWWNKLLQRVRSWLMRIWTLKHQCIHSQSHIKNPACSWPL